MVDAASFPRDKPCGDGLTPRAVQQLELLGLGEWLDAHIRHTGLRLAGFGYGYGLFRDQTILHCQQAQCL